MLYATDFGCDPTGVSDCTDAMQRFLVACRGQRGVIPAGTYSISAELVYGYLDGEPVPDLDPGSPQSGDDPLRSGGILEGEGFGATILKWKSPAADGGGGDDLSKALLRVTSPGCTIRDLTINCGTTNQRVGHGMVLQFARRSHIRVHVLHANVEGIRVDNGWRTGGGGALPGSNVGLVLDGCKADVCGSDAHAATGIRLVNTIPSSVYNYAVSMRTCQGNACSFAGIEVAGSGVRVEGGLSQNDGLSGVPGYGVRVVGTPTAPVTDNMILLPAAEQFHGGRGLFFQDAVANFAFYRDNANGGIEDVGGSNALVTANNGLKLGSAGSSLVMSSGAAPALSGSRPMTVNALSILTQIWNAAQINGTPPPRLDANQFGHFVINCQNTQLTQGLRLFSSEPNQVVIVELVAPRGGCDITWAPVRLQGGQFVPTSIRWQGGSAPPSSIWDSTKRFIYTFLYDGTFWLEIGASLAVG